MKVKVKLPRTELRATGCFDKEAGVKLGKPELREDKAFPVIEGYAAVFDVLSEPLWFGVRERIRPGAFSKSLAAGDDVRALVDHEPPKILGRNKAGTLRLREDNHGLHYDIDPPDTTVGRDTIVSLRRKDIDQSSFAFQVVEEEYNIRKEDNGDQTVIRELIEVKLFDVSVVTYPAYPQTSAGVRSLRSLWPDMQESDARTAAEAWARSVRDALIPRVVLLPALERRLRVRRLEMLEGPKVEDFSEYSVYSVNFSKDSWTDARASVWLRDHGFRADKVDVGTGSYRFRQVDGAVEPKLCVAKTPANMPRGVRMVMYKKPAAA